MYANEQNYDIIPHIKINYSAYVCISFSAILKVLLRYLPKPLLNACVRFSKASFNTDKNSKRISVAFAMAKIDR